MVTTVAAPAFAGTADTKAPAQQSTKDQKAADKKAADEAKKAADAQKAADKKAADEAKKAADKNAAQGSSAPAGSNAGSGSANSAASSPAIAASSNTGASAPSGSASTDKAPKADKASAPAKAAAAKPGANGACGEDSFLGTQFPASATVLKVGDQFGAVYNDESPLNQATVVLTVKDSNGNLVSDTTPQFGAAPLTKEKFATKIFAVVPSTLKSGTYNAFLHAEDTDQNKAGGDCGEANWTITVQGNQKPVLDLSILKTANPTTVQPKGTVVYTLNVTNAGPDIDHGVVITDPLPADEAFISASGAPCSASTGVVTCTIGDMAAGQSTVVLLTTTAPSMTGTFPNTATVRGDVTETTLTNNQSTATITVSTTPPPPGTPQVDLAITKTADPASVNINDPLLYTLRATNNGPDTATNVIVTDTLPDGLIVDGISSDKGSCTQAGKVITCSLGTMAKGDAVVIHVSTTAPGTVGIITNRAHVTGSEPDVNLSNNDASVDTPVSNVQGIVVTRTPAAPAAATGALPFTGSESGLMILLAIGLLSAGGGWYLLGQRKEDDAKA
jgi:uncharacterized repeat protein (TIGR01451 family)/LPXTG-motif cell wall-anchored protein